MPSRLPDELSAPQIHLRRYTGDELDAIVEAVTGSLEHLRPWMPWASADPLEPGLAAFIERSVEEFTAGTNFPYAIWAEGSGEFLGSTGLHPRLGPGRLEIGYWVRSSCTRRGIATAAARALTDAAFSQPEVDEVHIHCDEANIASAAVPRRLGYRLRRIVDDEISAPGETGRSMEWVMKRRGWVEAGTETISLD